MQQPGSLESDSHFIPQEKIVLLMSSHYNMQLHVLLRQCLTMPIIYSFMSKIVHETILYR